MAGWVAALLGNLLLLLLLLRWLLAEVAIAARYLWMGKGALRHLLWWQWLLSSLGMEKGTLGDFLVLLLCLRMGERGLVALGESTWRHLSLWSRMSGVLITRWWWWW